MQNTNALDADLRGLTKMAQVIVTMKIMPESPEVDLSAVAEEAKKKIVDFAGEGDMKVEEVPVAFGLKSLNIMFILDEAKGTTDKLEEDIAAMGGVNSVEVTDVRRAIG